MFVDSHCHLNDIKFQDDLDAVIQRAKDFNVKKMVTICTLMEDAAEILTLAKQYDELYCTVGVHPHDAKGSVEKGPLYNQLKSYVNEDKVIGLGETGLDYYYENSPKLEQKQAFQTHIQLAKETDLPLIVHTRDAEEDTIELLKSTEGIRGVIHCFSGSQWLADQALSLGFYISISGIVTFTKADELREIVKTIPLDRLLVETDAPYLAPVPKRGQRNEPAFMIYTAKAVAELHHISMDELATQTTNNFYRLFNKANK